MQIFKFFLRCANVSKDNLIQSFQCGGMEGRFINIYQPCGVDLLELLEVKVYGGRTPIYTYAITKSHHRGTGYQCNCWSTVVNS